MGTGDASPAGNDALPAASGLAMFAGRDLRRRLGRGIVVSVCICFSVSLDSLLVL